jgi:hypothetical protein
MDIEYRGVRATLPQEFLDDARDNMGIDVLGLLKTSINRMLRVAGKDTGDFSVAMQILNPFCESESCDFAIKVFRVDKTSA